MAKNKPPSNTPPEAVISIIGAGMTIEGDSDTDGSLRVEGTILGNVRARKSVVIGKDGLVDGSIYTQDAVIAGRVSGGIHAVSRLELQKTSEVLGEIEAPRMQVEEGAKVQGQVAVGESALEASFQPAKPQTSTGGGKGEPKTGIRLCIREDGHQLDSVPGNLAGLHSFLEAKDRSPPLEREAIGRRSQFHVPDPIGTGIGGRDQLVLDMAPPARFRLKKGPCAVGKGRDAACRRARRGKVDAGS